MVFKPKAKAAEKEEETETEDKEIKKFSDEFGSSDFYCGTRMKVKDLIGKKIILTGCQEFIGLENRSYLGINAKLEDEEINFTDSGVIADQVRKIKEEEKFPIETTIIEKASKKTPGRNYHTLS